MMPLLSWGSGASVGASVELGRKRDEPLNQRADFRDDRLQALDLGALGVGDRVRLPALELA